MGMKKLAWIAGFIAGAVAVRFSPQPIVAYILFGSCAVCGVLASLLYLEHKPSNQSERILLLLFGTFNLMDEIPRSKTRSGFAAACATFVGAGAGFVWRVYA